MTTRRIVFNLNNFLEDFEEVLAHRPDLIDDEVQRYKCFLSRTKEPLKTQVISYVSKHRLMSQNPRLKSFIMSCY